MKISKGREREIKKIRQANRAAAVGKLMLGEINSWQEFLEADRQNLENIPRSNIKAGLKDVQTRLTDEIKIFCKKNFSGMSIQNLSELYENIKKYRGLEMPLNVFEENYAKINKKVFKGNPIYLTVSISLWGLQFKYPEHELMKDIVEGLEIASETYIKLKKYESQNHTENIKNHIEIRSLVSKNKYAVRTTIISCFNLMEAYLNGIAWTYIQINDTSNLSNRQKKILEDTTSISIREKIKKYPEIISGKHLWEDNDIDFDQFINIVKPFRDSLVHPSPFSAPEKFGGYDKLRVFYRIDYEITVRAIFHLLNLIKKIHKHIYDKIDEIPKWLGELELCFNKYFKVEYNNS